MEKSAVRMLAARPIREYPQLFQSTLCSKNKQEALKDATIEAFRGNIPKSLRIPLSDPGVCQVPLSIRLNATTRIIAVYSLKICSSHILMLTHANAFQTNYLILFSRALNTVIGSCCRRHLACVTIIQIKVSGGVTNNSSAAPVSDLHFS